MATHDLAVETHAVLGVGAHLLAVPSALVEELFVLSDVHAVPGGPRHQRGVSSLRGRVLPVLDVRALLELPPAQHELDELLQLLTDREQDHHAWLGALERAVRERTAFTLTTDPHKCRFGLWYDQFRTDNIVLSAELVRFATPHAAIHAVGTEALALVESGRHDEAVALVEQARTGVLAELVVRFARAKEAIRSEHREIGVVVSVGAGSVVLAVDRAEAVTPLEPFDVADDPLRHGALQTPFARALARWHERPQPVLVLALERVLAGTN